MLQGVLFDMDGVLFDTERLALKIEGQVLSAMGLKAEEEQLLEMCGTNHAFVKQHLQNLFGPAFDYDKYETAVLAAMMNELDTNGMPEMYWMRELLNWLKENGYRMAVASSSRKEVIMHHLHASKITHFFDAVIGGDMVAASKPAPDIYLAAAEKLGIPPHLCAAVEDSPNGVRSASAAGCVTIMVPDVIAPTPEIEKLAGAVLSSLRDVPAFLQSTTSL